MASLSSAEQLTRLQPGPRAQLRAHLGNLEGAFAKLAQWLLELKPEEMAIAKFTTGEIERCLGVSRATIVRLCQYLGYGGFAEFRSAWIQETMRLASAQAPETGLPSVAAQVAEMTLRSIEEALLSIDITEFARAVEALCKASMIVLYGYADSYFLAQSVEHKLTRAGKHAKAFGQEDMLLAQGQFMKPGDVVVVISQSGSRLKVLSSVESLRSMGFPIIVVTSQADSPLARIADILLLTTARDVTVAKLPITLRAPQSMLLDMLVLEMVNRIGAPPMQLCEPKVASQL